MKLRAVLLIVVCGVNLASMPVFGVSGRDFYLPAACGVLSFASVTLADYYGYRASFPKNLAALTSATGALLLLCTASRSGVHTPAFRTALDGVVVGIVSGVIVSP